MSRTFLLHAKLRLYHVILETKRPNKQDIELGYLLAKDKDIQQHLEKARRRDSKSSSITR